MRVSLTLNSTLNFVSSQPLTKGKKVLYEALIVKVEAIVSIVLTGACGVLGAFGYDTITPIV